MSEDVIQLAERTDEAKQAYRDGLFAGFAIAAAIADEIADADAKAATDLHRRSARQKLVDEDRAEQTKISAQVLDECATEARAIACKIRERAEAHRQAGLLKASPEPTNV
jgi:vacuolar-type H+-ATPase subunit H